MILASVGVLGALIGSFLNVVIWRVPRGESIVSPPSACPNCHVPIHWFDNVPVVSWLVLRGRCRSCRAPISVRYPIVESVTAAAFVGVAWWLGSTVAVAPMAALVGGILEIATMLWLAAASIALVLIDLDVKRLPNAIVYSSAGVVIVGLGLSAWLLDEWARLGAAWISAAVIGAIYLTLALAIPGGMGLGDVKLSVVLGFALGWFGFPQAVVGTVLAFLLGGVFSILLIVLRRVGRRARIPFGPWMILGAWVGLVLGAPIAAAYLGIFGIG